MNQTKTIQYGDNKGTKTWKFFLSELKPKTKIFTPFNIITAPIILLGLAIIVYRFVYGLESVTNLSQDMPWGIWKAFNVVVGVAMAGGAYVLVFMTHVLHLRMYNPILKVAVLNGLLAYIFYSFALILELGRPLDIFNVIIGNDYGVSSILFLVAWHFMLYILCLMMEFAPSVAEWLNARKAHKVLIGIALVAVVFGITLSVLHQAGIGGLFMLAKGKVHALWYNQYMPLMFVIQSVFGGLALVIVIVTLCWKLFAYQLDEKTRLAKNPIFVNLAGICALTMFSYFFMHVIIFAHEQNWVHMGTGWGLWYLFEMVPFVIIPMFMFLYGYKLKKIGLINFAAVLTLIGIFLNRMNTSLIAFNIDAPVRYVPTIWEVIVSISVILMQIWVFRWIVLRMPVLRKSPEWARGSH
jgi:Ni/Fe-hydrogenase subunit HybB-like protein